MWQASTKPSLINATLVTLQRYVTWIPDAFVFETRLLETLVLKFLPVPAFRVNTLMVLTEVRACVPQGAAGRGQRRPLCRTTVPAAVAPLLRPSCLRPHPQVGSLSKPEYSLVFEQLYLGVMAQLVRFVPPDINIKVRDAGASWQYLRVLCWIAAPCTL